MELQNRSASLGFYIAAVVLVLMATGTVFVFSAGANINQQFELSRFYAYPPLRQLIFFPLAVVILFAASKFNYQLLNLDKGFTKSPIVYLLGFSVLLLIMTLVPGIGIQRNYARRWLEIPMGFGNVSFQPSELAKWMAIFFVAGFCCRYQDSLSQFRRRFLPLCGVLAIVVGLIVVEDFGTAAFISMIAFIIMLIAGAKIWHLLLPVPFALAAFGYVIIRSPARLKRIAAFLEPEKWADSAAYQANQSLIALGSGGLFGKGLGRGISKYGHLPEDTTDFIFAIIGEELGLFGAVFVIVLFMLFVWIGMLIVIRCREKFGQFLALGIVLAIGVQAAMNIAVVTVMVPTKGIPLPFVSAGGTSLLLSAAAVGVLMNIAHQNRFDIAAGLDDE